MFVATQPVLIVKKPRKHHLPRHSGVWKVAYADFVTAMMSLFLVLWLLSANADTRKKIGGYFVNPKAASQPSANTPASAPKAASPRRDEMLKLKEKLALALDRVHGSNKLLGQVDMAVTAEGLRIELVESDRGAYFESGRPRPTRLGRQMISILAKELGKLPNQLTIEGHTDAKPFVDDGRGYSNWELSADRANAARKVMVASGIDPDRVRQVRGFAGRNLRYPKLPDDYSNRRISVIVQFESAADDPTLGYPAQTP